MSDVNKSEQSNNGRKTWIRTLDSSSVAFNVAYSFSAIQLMLMLALFVRDSRPADAAHTWHWHLPIGGQNLHASIKKSDLPTTIACCMACAVHIAGFHIACVLRVFSDVPGHQTLCSTAVKSFLLWASTFAVSAAGWDFDMWDYARIGLRNAGTIGGERPKIEEDEENALQRGPTVTLRSYLTETGAATLWPLASLTCPALSAALVVCVALRYLLAGSILYKINFFQSMRLVGWVYRQPKAKPLPLSCNSGLNGAPVCSTSPAPISGQASHLDEAMHLMRKVEQMFVVTSISAFILYTSLPAQWAYLAPYISSLCLLAETAEQAASMVVTIVYRALKFQEMAALKSRLDQQESNAAIEKRASEAAAEGKKRFLRYIFHEVRVPFNAVKLVLDVLKLENQLSAEGRDSLALAQSSASSMSAIINDVLQLSAMEQGRAKIKVQPACLRRMLWVIERQMRPWAIDSHVTVRVTIEPNVPACLMFDCPHLSQVVRNFLSNALKFVPQDGTGQVEVHASVFQMRSSSKMPLDETKRDRVGDKPECTVRISVTDNGVGLSPEDRNRLFEPYMQINSGTNAKKVAGTGLGLAISREIIVQHGGTVGVQSELGKGSTFWLELPLRVSTEKPVNTTENEEVGQGAAEDRHEAGTEHAQAVGQPVRSDDDSLHVMIVDDDPTTLKLMKRVFEKVCIPREVLVSTASNGKDAVACMVDKRPQFITMDGQMPVLDGYAATRAIREVEKQRGWGRTPIVGCTGNALDEDQRAFIEAGADIVLTKPLSASALKDAVNDLFGRRKSVAPAVIASSGAGATE